MQNRFEYAIWLMTIIGAIAAPAAADQGKPFIHPGGLHTQAELDQVKAHVAAGEHPWIDSWAALLKDPKAQLTYEPAPQANMGTSRQRASADAVAIYLNAIRGIISGDSAYTDHAIAMCNAWATAVNQPPSGQDQPGLNGIFTYEFAIDGELLRMYVGTQWKDVDFDRFRNVMRQFLYPPCHDFLVHHDGTPLTHCWANWDACCLTAIGSIGVLCDDHSLFDEAVDYFKNGPGNGSIKNAVYVVYAGNLGQWQETGRDLEHAELGIGLLSSFCEIAGHQGVDLYGYDNNRLLAGTEYVARYTLGQALPYTLYNNCDDVNQYWPSPSQRGRLQRPIWEQLYNEYVVRRGLIAPGLTMLATLNRPEGFTHDDNLGYGTLLFTLKPSMYPPLPVPSAPADVTATAGVGRVHLRWSPPPTANGFTIRRSTTAKGPYTEIAQYRGIIPTFDDTKVTSDTTYFYTIAADNQAGPSTDSAEVSATPITATPQLPASWGCHDIGATATPVDAKYASMGEGTFIVTAASGSIGGSADAMGFTATAIKGDCVLTIRLTDCALPGAGKRSRLGIAMRASLNPDAAEVALVLGDLGYREAHFGIRDRSGAPMKLIPGNGYSGHDQFPTWFRLERIRNIFTAYQSDTGDHWYKVGSADVAMNDDCIGGIALAADSTTPISLTCDHVSIQHPGQ